LELDRDDEAEHWIGVADAVGGADDVITQALIRQVKAKLLSRRGRQAEAEAVARDAVALIEQTDMLKAIADAKLDLADVLRAAGEEAEALQAIEEAAGLYERKRHLVGMAQTRALLESARSRSA
jgi:tetratricopeptide (TPR) repeat protein